MKSQIIIEVNDKMQQGYSYPLSAETGESFQMILSHFILLQRCLRWGCLKVSTVMIAKMNFRQVGLKRQKLVIFHG
jgi:hypothetical protein